MLKSSDWKLNRIIERNLCRPAVAQGLCDQNCGSCPLLREVRKPREDIDNIYAFSTWLCRELVAKSQEFKSAEEKENFVVNRWGEVVQDNPFVLIGGLVEG